MKKSRESITQKEANDARNENKRKEADKKKGKQLKEEEGYRWERAPKEEGREVEGEGRNRGD